MAESAVLAPNPSDPAALIAEPSTSIRISPPVWMFEVPLSIAPNPVAMEPDARAPTDVREEVTTLEPRVVALNTAALLT